MSDPYIGEIKIWAFNWAPRGWALCNGAILPLANYQALFALITNNFGGDGRTTFALPDLRGRTPVGIGTSPGTTITYGRNGLSGGAETVTLNIQSVPSHIHTVTATSVNGTQALPAGNVLANPISVIAGTGTDFSIYLPSATWTGNTQLAAGSVSPSGGNAGHNNMQPFAVVNFSICTTNGLFPPRN